MSKQEDKSMNSENSISTHNNIEDDILSKTDEQKTDSLKKFKKNTQIKCPLCPKVYSSKSRAAIHQRTHTGTKPFSCPFCQKRFNEKGNLTCHIRIHTGERPYQCTFAMCNLKFKTKGQLSVHLNLHSDLRPYRCNICSAQFKRNERLKIHLLAHTGEKPYKCEICSKTFRERGNMTCHVRKHNAKMMPHEEANRLNAVGNSIIYKDEVNNKRSKALLIEELLNKICTDEFQFDYIEK